MTFSSSHRPLAFLAAITLGGVVGGCHSPGGGIMPHTGGSHTFYSTEAMQKTVTLVDTRSNTVVFSIDIPVGKQLTMDFDSGEGDDPVNTPDLLRYEIMDLGTRIGKLNNSMTVPNAASRRLDVLINSSPQYAAKPAQRPLRTDELADRPDWWTPEGGPMPEDKAMGMYDD